MLRERALQRMIAAQPLDSRDLGILGMREWNEARADRLAIEENRARATFSLAASFLRPGKLAVNTQRVEQTREWWRVDVDVASVYTETHATS
jgi:hypothetical protein